MHRQAHRAGWRGMTFWLMTGVVIGLWVSGWVMHALPAEDLADMSPAQAGLRHACGVAHGVGAWLFGVLCGRGVWPHVRVMWHRHVRQRQWLWGLLNLCLFVFLSAGGLVLLYGSPWLHDTLSPWHFWTGLAGLGGYLAHTWRRFVPGLAGAH